MRRFFYDKTAVCGEEIQINEHDAKHIVKVLRMTVGTPIEMVCAGQCFTAELSKVANGDVRAKLLDTLDTYEESDRNIYLIQGVAKGEKMDFILQKSVELGLHTFIATECTRSVVRIIGDKEEKRLARWNKISEEAAKQCGRIHIPEAKLANGMKQAIAMLPEDTAIILAWEEEENLGLKTILPDITAKNIAIIVGPEGGLTEDEVTVAKNAGAQIVSLGKRILRTETAALALLSITQYQLGDLGGACRND